MGIMSRSAGVFDADVGDGMRYQSLPALQPSVAGDRHNDNVPRGLTICYDLRFAHLIACFDKYNFFGACSFYRAGKVLTYCCEQEQLNRLLCCMPAQSGTHDGRKPMA